MTEPQPKLDSALRHVAPSWDAARTERTLVGAQHKQRVQRRVRVALASTTGVVLVAMAVVGALRIGRDQPAVQTLPTGERSVSFTDGSRAFLLDAPAQVVVERVSDTAIEVRLAAGRARFEVAPRRTRRFKVVCDDVVVVVIGTGFELLREGRRTHVQVTHGRVAVRWPGGTTELGAGDAGWFPATSAVSMTGSTTASTNNSLTIDSMLHEQAPVQPEGDAQKSESTGTKRTHADTWRQHAEQGEFQQAYRLLEHERARVSDDVEELLLAADAARLSGHAAAAVPFLQRVVESHAADPRAPLAAFTLGGVLLNQLGRPREAEGAYAHARAMSPSSALSQDALARQVEAAYRAEDESHARTLAHEYLERYPNGRRVKAVRRFGGLP